MPKVPFPTRVDAEVIAHIQALAKERQTSYSDVIAMALDALAREQKAGSSLPERVDHLEKNLSAFFDLVMTFSEKIEEKFNQASLYEKERLKSLYLLLIDKMAASDKAQEDRVLNILQAIRTSGTSK